MNIPNSRSIPVEYIKECFEYREEYVDGVLQGNLYWKHRENIRSSFFEGKKAGGLDNRGYYQVSLTYNKKLCRLRLHNVIWIIHKNTYPHSNLVIDHIDRNKTNNLFSNLRELSVYQNNLNSGPSKNKPSRYKGVFYDQNKWQVKIRKRDENCVGRHVFSKVVHDEIQGALLYNQEVVKYHDPEFCYQNDISLGYTNKEYPNMPRHWVPGAQIGYQKK